MSGIVRVGDLSTGHGNFPPRPVITGSDSVFLNGLPVVRVGDVWAEHCDNSSCHLCNQAVGSSTGFVNGMPLVTQGMATGCGDFVAIGSTDTFSNS